MVRTIKTKIIVMNEGEHVQIEPYGKHIVRVRVSADEIQDLDWTLLPKEESEATIKKVLSSSGTEVLLQMKKSSRFPPKDPRWGISFHSP